MRNTICAAFALLSVATDLSAADCKVQVEELLQTGDDGADGTVLEVCMAEAERGDEEALYHLSFFYLGLQGLETGVDRAVATICASAEKGYPTAQYWLGWQYEVGNYLRRDNKEAIAWYEKAAEGGSWMAQDRLRQAYLNGELGLEPSVANAAQYSRER